MEDVGVRELRQNLSVWLGRVQRGEAFRVTDRGRPVAVLRPMPAASGRLEELAAAGRVRWATTALADLPAPQSLPGADLSGELARLREEDER